MGLMQSLYSTRPAVPGSDSLVVWAYRDYTGSYRVIWGLHRVIRAHARSYRAQGILPEEWTSKWKRKLDNENQR